MPKEILPTAQGFEKHLSTLSLPVSDRAIKSKFFSSVKSERNLNFFGSPKPLQFQKNTFHLDCGRYIFP